MNLNQYFHTLERYAEILKTPNLEEDTIRYINHSMRYIVDRMHFPIVKMVDDLKNEQNK